MPDVEIRKRIFLPQGFIFGGHEPCKLAMTIPREQTPETMQAFAVAHAARGGSRPEQRVASHSASAAKLAVADMKKLSETLAAKDLKRAISALIISEVITMLAARNSKLARVNVKRGLRNSTKAKFPQTLRDQAVSSRMIQRTLLEYGSHRYLDPHLSNDSYPHFRGGHRGQPR